MFSIFAFLSVQTHSEDFNLIAGTTKEYTFSNVRIELAFVPGGIVFPLGVDDAGNNLVTIYKNPTHKIEQAFWISTTETTYALWKTVKNWATKGKNGEGAGKYSFFNVGRQGGGAGYGPIGSENSPVTMVSWRDAIVWCNALTEWTNANSKDREKLLPVYYVDENYKVPLRSSIAPDYDIVIKKPITKGSVDKPYVYSNEKGNVELEKSIANGFRLPGYFEWELAARWRSDSVNSVEGYENPYFTKGNSPSGSSNAYNDAQSDLELFVNAGKKSISTIDVKSRKPNALGIFDMSGNVREWCFEPHPKWPLSRVDRGGGYGELGYGESQVGFMRGDNPVLCGVDVGFRVVRRE